MPEIGKALNDKNQATLKEAEDSFQNSELLQKLKAQSAENKDKYASIPTQRCLLAHVPAQCFRDGCNALVPLLVAQAMHGVSQGSELLTATMYTCATGIERH